MNIPKALKPRLQGAAVGAAVLAIIGFGFGGWMTGGGAERMAKNQAHAEVVAAMVPVCLQLSSQDPEVATTIQRMKDSSTWDRPEMVMKAGWATMPGSKEPNRHVADACVDKLTANF